MKSILLYLLILSIGVNIFFVVRKMQRFSRDKEIAKLRFYKEITYEEGYDYFVDHVKLKYPETLIKNKYSIVYRWDSTSYDFIYRDQMKILDSIAAMHGNFRFEYFFVTEMNEESSVNYLKNQHDEFKHVKMLYGMDDFISGLHNIKGLELMKPVLLGKAAESHKSGQLDFSKMKQTSFYLIMEPGGKVIHTNGRIYGVLKDTAFLNKLNTLAPAGKSKLLN